MRIQSSYFQPYAVLIFLQHFFVNLNQILYISSAVLQKFINYWSSLEIRPVSFLKNFFHFFLELIGTIRSLPCFKYLIQPGGLDMMQFFKRMFVCHVMMVHFLINISLLKIDVHCRCVKNGLWEDVHTMNQSYNILLASMKYFNPLLIFKELFDLLSNQLIKIRLILLSFPNVNDKNILSLIYTAYLDEIYIPFLREFPLQVYTVLKARTKNQTAVLEFFHVIYHQNFLFFVLVINFKILFLYRNTFGYLFLRLFWLTFEQRSVYYQSLSNERPKVNFFSHFKQSKFKQITIVCKFIHINLIDAQTSHKTINFLYRVNHFFVFLQILFNQIHQFLVIFFCTLKENIVNILRSQLLKHFFKVFSFLSEINMQRSFSLITFSCTVNQSSQTRLKDLTFLIHCSIIDLLFKDLQQYLFEVVVHFLYFRYFSNTTYFLLEFIFDVKIIVSQLPKTTLKLSKFILVCMIETKFSMFLFHPLQWHHFNLILFPKSIQKSFVDLMVHFSSYLLLMPEFGVNIVHCKFRIFRFFMIIIISKQRNVVHFVFLAFGRLPILHQKLLFRIIIHVLNVMHIKASLTCFSTVPSHIKPANKLFLYILWHFFQSVFFNFLDSISILIRLLYQNIQNFIQIGFVFQVKNTPRRTRRNYYVDLCVSFYTGQVSHEVTKFAESL